MRVIVESFTEPDVELMKGAVARLADDVTIDLLIAGGVPGQRIEYRASIPARGDAEVSHVDELRGVDERYSAPVGTEELTTLARRIDVDALLDLPPNAGERYVPDSVIGSVVVTAGNARITLRFPLDDEPPPAGEEVAMEVDPGQGPFVLRAAEAPASVRPALSQLAAVVNRLAADRS